MNWEDYRCYQWGYHDKERIQSMFSALGMLAILILLTLILGPDMGLEGDMWRNAGKYILKEKKPPQVPDRSKEKLVLSYCCQFWYYQHTEFELYPLRPSNKILITWLLGSSVYLCKLTRVLKGCAYSDLEAVPH